MQDELDLVIKQRNVQRNKRMRVPMTTGALVGYTNAGKSSLLNKLTGADVLVEDKLFAPSQISSESLIESLINHYLTNWISHHR